MAGLALLWRSGQRFAAAVLLGTPAFMSLLVSTAITSGTTRLLFPVFPFLAVAAVAGVLHSRGAVAERRRRRRLTASYT
jgi:hypothetical protein